MNRVCILATPRSGSTLIASILGEYFRQTRGDTYLHEYFNLRQPIYFRNNRLQSRPFLDRDDPPFEILERAVRLRIEILDNTPGSYFYSVHPGQLSTELMRDWLFKTHFVIFGERQNLFEQYVSYLISLKSGKWYEPSGIRVGAKSLSVSSDFAERIVNRMVDHHNVYTGFKARFPSNPVLVYEDVVSDLNAKRICSGIGLNEEVNFEHLDLPKKQNPNLSGKLDYFTDPERVMNIYRRSALHEWFPIA